jgi:hypothetical protein
MPAVVNSNAVPNGSLVGMALVYLSP